MRLPYSSFYVYFAQYLNIERVTIFTAGLAAGNVDCVFDCLVHRLILCMRSALVAAISFLCLVLIRNLCVSLTIMLTIVMILSDLLGVMAL